MLGVFGHTIALLALWRDGGQGTTRGRARGARLVSAAAWAGVAGTRRPWAL